VANSGAMEKEGLIRAVAKLKDADLQIDVIVTDRHPQIQKWIRENLPGTTHYYDVWHVAKGKCLLTAEHRQTVASKTDAWPNKYNYSPVF
jgi:solute carrier family 8 (sodium/calcium exchanger)